MSETKAATAALPEETDGQN